MKIDIEKYEQKIIYVLKGEIKEQTLIELREIINDSISNDGIQNIEVNISGVIHLDSLKLGEFMRIKKWLQNKNIGFKLINPTQRVRFLIESASFEPFLLGDENY